MSVRFEIDDKDIKILEEKISKLPNRAEKEINDVLHTVGVEIATDEITNEMPVSMRNGRMRPKNHAKMRKWSKSETDNLGFTIKSRGGASGFDYLVFPNEGRGRSNPTEQRFMEKGIERATPRIMEKLTQRVDKVLKEEL